MLLPKSERENIDFYSAALIYAGFGEKENALIWLEKACDARDGMAGIMLKVDPRMQGLRGELRVQKILERMNLA